MKKILLVILILIAVSVWVLLKTTGKQTVTTSPSPSPYNAPNEPIFGLVVNEADLVRFEVNGKTYRTTWAVVDPGTISVGVNRDLASGSAEIRDRETCRVLTSGSFYGTDNRPLGLIINGSTELAPWRKSVLLDGILSYNGSELRVSREEADTEGFIWAVQAGPVIWDRGKAEDLARKNNEPARRILAGVTNNNKLLLAAVVVEDSLFSGPTLPALPAIVTKLQEITGTTLTSAVNLDGGTASAFLSGGVSLKELKPIGSWICVR